MELREENSELREKLLHSFMDAIIQSINEEESDSQTDSYFWSDRTSTALIETFKKLMESSMTILDIRNPLQINSL